HLAREKTAKKERAADEVKAKARRAEEAKAIAAAVTKAADEAAKEAAEAARKVVSEGVAGTPAGNGGHPNAMGVGGNERKANGVGSAPSLRRSVRARVGIPLGSLSEPLFTPTGWDGVDLEYVRGVTRHLTVVREFDETRKDWGYQVANAAGVERCLRLFASAHSFELRVLWMLHAMGCMQLARVRFHRFDEFKAAMRELHERERLERWTVDEGRIELCNDETFLEYIVAFVWTLTPSGFSVLPASAWSSVWASPTASTSTWAREDAQVAARLSAARPANPFVGYNPPSGPQQDGQLTAAERQAAADYRAGAIAAPQQVVVPMSSAATAGESGEEEKSQAAEEEEPLRDPKDRLPSLHPS
ncbi:hypothetical protein B5M09_013820, partial [Aphanomyces astaci]